MDFALLDLDLGRVTGGDRSSFSNSFAESGSDASSCTRQASTPQSSSSCSEVLAKGDLVGVEGSLSACRRLDINRLGELSEFEVVLKEANGVSAELDDSERRRGVADGPAARDS